MDPPLPPDVSPAPPVPPLSEPACALPEPPADVADGVLLPHAPKQAAVASVIHQTEPDAARLSKLMFPGQFND
jgi:hypothetical protein